tara:strand:- start:561 stop:1361 length:801 start_codon:yes stop_codon:yes gene_type:complete
MFIKFFLKIIKLFIIVFSNFRKNQDLISELNVWLGIQQGRNAPVTNKMEVSYILRFLSNSNQNIILDVGAHQGKYTDEIIKQLPNSKLYLFEPSKKSHEYLRSKYKNIDEIEIFDYCLSDTVGEKILYFNSDMDSRATLTHREESRTNSYWKEKEVVKSNKLSEFWRNELSYKQIDLLKLDVEGEEFTILNDVKENLHKIRLVQFEFAESNIATKIFFKDFWELLNDKFIIYRYTHFNQLNEIKEYSEYEEFFRFTNFLAVNKELN